MSRNLDTRLARLEAAARPRLADALGGYAIVEMLADGRTRLHDGRVVTDAQLAAIVARCGGGHVLDLALYPGDEC